MTSLVRDNDIFRILAADELDFLRSNAEPRTLFHTLAETESELGRTTALEILSGLSAAELTADRMSRPGKDTIARYLETIAALWPTLGTDSFLAALESTVASIQDDSGDSDARTVRTALATVIAAQWHRVLCDAAHRDEWIEWVDAVCTELAIEDNDRSPVLGARLIAIGMTARTFEVPDDERALDATVERLFAIGGAAAPRQLHRGCLTHLLSHASPARDRVTTIISALLDAYLPARNQIFTPGNELWAAAARSALMDPRIGIDIIETTVRPRSQRTHAPDNWGPLAIISSPSPRQRSSGARSPR